MVKMLAATFSVALLAGAIALFLGFMPRVEAHSLPSAKGDRLDAKPYGPACSEQSWPYYETNCLRNMVTPTREARQVRIVSVDKR
jgi:hypothetical protein